MTMLTIADQPIIALDEMRDFLYRIPEGVETPSSLARFVGREEVDPAELYQDLLAAGSALSGDDDHAIATVRLLTRRILAEFPDVAD
jgi:hypothetical protein